MSGAPAIDVSSDTPRGPNSPGVDPSSMLEPRWITVLSWILVAAAVGTSVWTFASYLLQRPEYQATPIVLLAIGYLGLERLRRRTDHPEYLAGQSAATNRWLRWGAMASGLVGGAIVLGGVSMWSPWLVIVGLIVLAAALVFRIHRLSIGPSLWPVWLLLLLVVPPPLNLGQELTTKLQLLSSSLASILLEVIGILHVLNGNTLEIAGRELFVDEACSGIVSLITIIAAIAIYCVWQARSLPHTLIMLVIGTAWTVLMNAVRIATITVALARFDVDWTEGVSHAALAMVLFAISLAVLHYLDFVLREFLRPIDESEVAYEGTSGGWLVRFWDRWVADHDLPAEIDEPLTEISVATDTRTTQPPGLRLTHRLFRLPLLAVLIVTPAIGVQFWTMPERPPIVDSRLAARSLDTALSLNRDADPAAEISALNLVDFRIDHRDARDIWGEHSRQWEYVDGDGHRYLVSLDFLFGPGWHDIKYCYPGIGWSVSDYRSHPHTAGQSDVSLNAFDLHRSDSDLMGYAVFLGFRPDGTGIVRPTQHVFGQVESDLTLRQRVVRRFVQAVEEQEEQPIGTYYQLQVVCFDNKIDSQMEDLATAALLASWRVLSDRLAAAER